MIIILNISKNIEKAYGHVYRAGYDRLDWTALSLRESISKEMGPFSLETINHVFPEYFETLRPEIEEISEEIGKKRGEKDVADDNPDNLIDYINLMRRLHEYYKEVIKKTNILIEYEGKLKKEKGSERITKIFVALIIAIVSGLIGYLL